MGSKMGPIIRQIREAAMNAARHSDELTGLPRLHKTQLTSMARRVRDQDRFDGPGGGFPAPRQQPYKKPDGSDPDEMVTKPEYRNPDGSTDWSEAPQGGFTLRDRDPEIDGDGPTSQVPDTHDHHPQAGEVFDRYGHPGGRNVSPVDGEPFSWGSRSLPYFENPGAYHQYRWTRDASDIADAYANADPEVQADVDAIMNKYGLDFDDLATVQRGEAAPAFGQPGGATQDVLNLPPALLEKLGMIEEL